MRRVASHCRWGGWLLRCVLSPRWEPGKPGGTVRDSFATRSMAGLLVSLLSSRGSRVTD